MRKLLLMTLMLVIGFASGADALTFEAKTTNVGYTAVWFEFTSADVDSSVRKIVVFWGTSPETMVRMDSLTTVTDPGDTIKITQGIFENGTTYYWYAQATDSVTSDLRYPALFSNPAYPYNPYLSFTTDDWIQTNNLIYDGYTTAGIECDTVSAVLQSLLDSIRLHLDKTTSAATYSATITSVTDPDTFKVTGLDEGVTYYYQTIAFLADTAIIDSSTIGSFTTTDLQMTLTRIDSGATFKIKVDTVNAYAGFDSVILQWGAGLNAITAVAETITTVTEPDTVSMTGLIEGGTYSYRVLGYTAFDDSAGVETTAVGTYTRPHNALHDSLNLYPNYLGENYNIFLDWDFDSHTDDYSTDKIPIVSDWIRVHAFVDGEDDFATSDSINVFLWSHAIDGDSTAIDTIITLEADTGTIAPLKYRMVPGEITDSSLTYFPQFDWGLFYSISADMSNDDGQADSATTLGVRSVHVIIEEIE